MLERRLWHPVASLQELDAARSRPLPVQLLGEDLVLWRGDDARVQAFPDQCPHRGARLSLGRVLQDDGPPRLACAYHGWQFGVDGSCLRIPAAPALTPTPRQAVATYETAVAHGLVWVRLEPGAGPLPHPADVPARAVLCGPYDVASSAPRTVENFLDTAHFGFVHEGWLGDAGHREVPPYEVALDVDGRPGVPHYAAWQPRASSNSVEGRWIDYRYEVLSPYAALLVKQASPGAAASAAGAAEPGAALQEAYALWCAPVEPERCRVWFSIYTSDLDVPDAELIAFEATIFSQDQPVLESQRPRRLPLDGREAHGPADRLATAYRRYLKASGITFGVC